MVKPWFSCLERFWTALVLHFLISSFVHFFIFDFSEVPPSLSIFRKKLKKRTLEVTIMFVCLMP